MSRISNWEVHLTDKHTFKTNQLEINADRIVVKPDKEIIQFHNDKKLILEVIRTVSKTQMITDNTIIDIPLDQNEDTYSRMIKIIRDFLKNRSG